ncbi:hypothetical protein AMATHDRAFT_154051 [Amanita thiersii Skay4041]|uniref:Protein kinase domain-containing protein n=1 Tax=Amanita thiersii Skay4041 TaxID=703135 RepID=A0A2A9NEK5_9AGAR|nr:hypothetical protein AMATHDRAFT_154051 [Amanita thiersii Skay4041]
MDALRRESRGLPAVVRSWSIGKFVSLLYNFVLQAHDFPCCCFREDVRLGDVVGRGFFSTVYKATWRGRTVAIKILNPEIVSTTDFNYELTIWRTLSTKEANILKLYGSSSFSGNLPRMLISPYLRHGNLSDYMKRCEWEITGNNSSLFLEQGLYKDVDHLKFMYDIALGMDYIHSKGILHGDLRAANVLVTDSIRCVIADFGCSKYRTHLTYEQPALNRWWQAPEIMGRGGIMTRKTDVYAYALTCIEIVTFGNIPWPNLSDDLVKEAVLKNGQEHKSRPPYPELVKILDIEGLLLYWNDAPALRPKFTNIIQQLQILRYPRTI